VFHYNLSSVATRQLLCDILEEPISVFKDALAFAKYSYKSRLIARHMTGMHKADLMGEYFIFISWWYQLLAQKEDVGSGLLLPLQGRVRKFENIVCSFVERESIVQCIDFYCALLRGRLVKTQELLQFLKPYQADVSMVKGLKELSPICNEDELMAIAHLRSIFCCDNDWTSDELVNPTI
jgi:hypothetical protein